MSADTGAGSGFSRKAFLGVSAAAILGVAGLARASAATSPTGTATPGTTTLSGAVTLPDGLVIPAGQVVQFDPAVNTTVQTPKNVVVEGTLRMRPNPGVVHRLQFIGIDESKFVGGGSVVLDSDVGLWVTGVGVLDAVGQPKAGWNRTGTDPTWVAGDELRTAPQAVGQYSVCPPFTLGSTVPKITKFGVDYPTEVFNLTRSVIIGGTPGGRAHVAFLGGSAMTCAPQTIKWVRFEHVGPRKVTPTGKPLPGPQTSSSMVLGRYGLHFHHCMDGTAGSLIEGVVVTGCGTRAFVPHGSNGITFRDCIAYDVAQDGYWWDPHITANDMNESHDITYDHCAAFRIFPPSDASDSGRASGFELPSGARNSAINCVAAGVSNASAASGFIWPEQALIPRTWTFTGCTAHNNNSHGIFYWQNDPTFIDSHVITDFVAYRNFWINIGHGAYTNKTSYNNVRCWGTSRSTEAADFLIATVTNVTVRDSIFDAENGPYSPLQISHHSISAKASDPPNLVQNVQLFNPGNRGAVELREDGTGASKTDLVNVTVNGADLEPANFVIFYMAPATVVRVQRRNGTAYRLNADGTGTAIPPFA